MSVLKKLFGKEITKKNAKIVLLGPSKAGKTTLVKYLEQGKPVEEEVRTTLGIDIRSKHFKIENWNFSVIDVGGQELYQKTFWNLGVQQADAVIYVIDGLVRRGNPNFKQAKNQFEYMKKLVEDYMPILILVNKQDLVAEKPLTAEEAFKLYELDTLKGRSFNLVPTSAKYGTGVDLAMKWIVEKLKE